MKTVVAGRTLALFALACSAKLGAQSSVPATVTSPPTIPANVLTVPAGESLLLELRSALNSGHARNRDHADFTTTNEVLVGDQVAIPRGTTVRATVIRAKRAGPLRKAQLQLEFDEIALANGTVQPLAANLTRAAWSQPRGEHTKAQVVWTVASNAAAGAVWGVIFSGRRGAVQGASAGAAIGCVGVLTQRGPELDFPPGMIFEIELTKSLNVPVTGSGRSPVASSQPSPLSPAGPAHSESPKEGATANTSQTQLPHEAGAGGTSHSQSEDSSTLAANRTTTPVPTTPVPAVDTSRGGGDLVGFKLKVDVDLVLIEATVRDEHGRIVDHLQRENFRLFEDRVAQEIAHFSRDELPLSVALVLDRSFSMAPVLDELRRAAYETLSLLKPDDQVALFAFAATPDRLEDLTTERQLIADDIAAISVGGGTNITDALFNAALYLGRAAPHRRHAIILVSDDEGTVPGYASEGDVIRLALETETAIYNVKIGGGTRFRAVGRLPVILHIGSVPKIARQSGGEVIDANQIGSVRPAMATVISRLKQRYTLGYYSTNRRHDGAFRKIEIRAADGSNHSSSKYAVYARRGYYARMEQAASRSFQP